MGRITSAPSMLKREHKGFPRSRGNARQGKGGRHPVGATLVVDLPLRSAQGGRGERSETQGDAPPPHQRRNAKQLLPIIRIIQKSVASWFTMRRFFARFAMFR